MEYCKQKLIRATHTGEGAGVQWGRDSICGGCRAYAGCEIWSASYGNFYRGWEVVVVDCDWFDKAEKVHEML